MKKEKGSVTIFLIIIIAAVFFFNAVLIDYARVMAANKQAEAATKAVVRSAMAGFDSKLLHSYGLFAHDLTEQEMEQLITDILQGNMVENESGYFRFVDTQFDKVDVKTKGEIARPDIFEYQILEDMKYKGPVEFVEVLEKLGPLAKGLRETQKAVKTLNEINKIYDQREEKMKKIEENMAKYKLLRQSIEDELGKRLNPRLTHLYEHLPKASSDTELQNSITKFSDIVARYEVYVYNKVFYLDWVQSMMNRTPGDGEGEATEAEEEEPPSPYFQDYENNVRSFWKALESTKKKIDEGKKLLDETTVLLNEAQALNNEIKQILKDANNKQELKNYDKVGNKPRKTDQNVQQDDMNKLEGILGDAEKTIHIEEDQWYDTYRDEITAEINSLDDLKNAYENYEKKVQVAVPSNGGTESAKSIAEGLFRELKKLESAYDHFKKNPFKEPVREMKGAPYDKNAKDGIVAQSTASLATMLQLLAVLETMGNNVKQVGDNYRRLEDYNKAYTQFFQDFNSNVGGANSQTNINADPTEASEQATDFMNSIFKNMGALLEELRDETYVNEYTLLYFKNFGNLETQLNNLGITGYNEILKVQDVEQLTQALEGLQNAALLFDVDKQEVEYVINGYHKPGVNLALTYTEIFMIRLVIRTMEGFVYKSGGHPLLVLARAIQYGIEYASKDIMKIFIDGKIELSRLLKEVETEYKDYLRLLLLLHLNREKRYVRIQSLISFKEGNSSDGGNGPFAFDLREKNTYFDVEAEASVKLWFLPGIMRQLNMVGILDGKLNGENRYIIRKRISNYY